MTKVIINNTSSRRIVRTIDQAAEVSRVIDNARSKDGVAISVTHGGGVANSYKYPAVTTAVGTVAIIHNGVEYVYSEAAQIPANKVTLSGAGANTIGTRLFDDRLNKKSKAAEKSRLLCRVAAELGCWE
jgi:hypothetical protein